MVGSLTERLVDEFIKKRPLYEQLDSIIAEKIQKIIANNKFFVMDISHRVKTAESLRGKVNKKKGKYKNLTSITDLCAARIICYFENTVDEIAKELEKYFVVDIKESVDKRAALQATQFGYLSLHYIISLRPDDGYSPELCAIRVEVQIRTVLQHAWAEIEHDLGYKSTFGVPRPIRREFSRVAGLLEIADNQFTGLRRSIKKYEAETRAKIQSGDCLEMPLDEVTLNEFTKNNNTFINKAEALCNEIGVDYFPITIESYLETMDFLGMKTLGDMVKGFELNDTALLKMIKWTIEYYKFDFLTTGTIFKLMFAAEMMRQRFTQEKIVEFFKLQTYDEADAIKKSKELISSMEQLGLIKNV